MPKLFLGFMKGQRGKTMVNELLIDRVNQTLRQLALTAGTTTGENGFTYGLLYAREQHVAEAARQQVRRFTPSR